MNKMYRVPKGQRGAGRLFADKRAYLTWANKEIERENRPIEEQYRTINWGNYIANRMLSKCRVVGKPKRARLDQLSKHAVRPSQR